jgi:tetratricopeptide (TPR) repeat protein
MRKVIPLLLALAAVSASGFAQTRKPADESTLAVQSDPRQMAVAAALVVAGYAAPPSDPASAALRDDVRKGLSGVDADLRSRLAAFYAAHRRKNAEGALVDEAADALRYRALAVFMNPPPSFSVAVAESRIPADLRDVIGFAALAGDLYRTPEFRALQPRLVQAYDSANGLVGKQIAPTVTEILQYLRTRPVERIEVPAVRDREGKILRPGMTRVRRLRVFVDPLVGGQVVAVRGDLLDAESDLGEQLPGDRFAVFAGPLLGADEAALRIGVIRFVLEPIVERHKEEIEDSREALDALIARSEPARTRYTNARVSLVTDSLVSALDARFRVRKDRLTPNGAIAALGDAYARGEVLGVHFYERLTRYEEVGLDIGVYFPEFLRSLDLDREKTRGEQIAAAGAAAAREPKAAASVDAIAADMLAADRLITEKRFDEARPILERVLRADDGNARALFGLAQVIENSPDQVERDTNSSDEDRINAQAERLEAAVNLYRKAALNASSRELWLASWSHVYAGRILDFLDLRDEAIAEYQAAVKVGDVPQGGYKAAQAGLASPSTPEPR